MIAFATGQSHFVSVRGSRVHYQRYNDAQGGKPGLLFVHGMWAHSHWWDHIAPFFMDRYSVTAIDLSGLGDSDARPAYSADGFADDVIAVLEDTGMSAATVVAHSFGGTPSLIASGRRPDLIARLVIIDSRLNIPDLPMPSPDGSDRMTSKRLYEDPAEAIARYRLIPAGGPVAPDILRRVAQYGLRREGDHWVWKFDLGIDTQLFHRSSGMIPPGIETPVDYIFGENSRSVSREAAAAISDYLPCCGRAIEIPGAGHHILLEQPDILVSVLRALFARFPG